MVRNLRGRKEDEGKKNKKKEKRIANLAWW